jgi:hypothetical protein
MDLRLATLQAVSFYFLHNVSMLLDCRRTAAIQQRVTAVLRSISKEAFADSF